MGTQSSHPRLILVDGSSYLYRAFHALPPLTNSRGEPTGAIYGVGNMLRKLLEEYDPQNIAVVFDAKGKTFRDELFEQYKANRPPMPEALAPQVEPLLDLVRALGLPVIREPGVEADDVIGTLARQVGEAGGHTLISTGDKDMAQLVSEHVTLVNTMTDTVLDAEGVREKFGVGPERIIDFIALVGDPSDNIPGVAKVGPKTAAKWLTQFGSLEAIIEHAEEIPGKVGESLRAHLEVLSLYRELAVIRTDVPLEMRAQELTRRPQDVAELRRLAMRFEFTSWLEQLPEAEGVAGARTGAVPAADYEAILTEAALEEWLARLEAAELFAFDTETTSLHYMEARIVGVSFAAAPGRGAYVPLAHTYSGAPPQLERAHVLERLRPLLEDAQRAKLGHNLKYDMSVLAHHGIALAGIRHDTMLESYVLNATANRHDLDSVALKYLGHKTIRYEDVAGKGAAQIGFEQVAIEDATPYAAEDAELCLRLHGHLWPQLEAAPPLARLYSELEIPLVPVLSRMERNGVLIDREALARQSAELARRMDEIEAEAHRLAGKPFNLGSPKQIQEILFTEQGLPVVRRTPKGVPSTSEDVLAELANDYPLPRVILEHRGLAKLKSTYTDRIPEQINPDTGRVHTSFHQAVAATGRLSSSEPNLQNIPIRSEAGRRIRQAFIAPPGHRLMAADYSQIELRIMAHLSGDPGLLGAFEDNLDIHAATAAEVFGADLGEVTAEQRRAAKTINFGLMYGMSAYGLGRQLAISREEAQAYIDRYFARYPGVKAFMDRIVEQARREGYVETLFGRRLYIPEIGASNGQRRQYAERTAINAPMQGSAADIIKRAMLRVDAWLLESGLDARMIMQVHDELVFEVAEAALEAVREAVRRRMTAAADLSVPLEVDVGVGYNWDEAH